VCVAVCVLQYVVVCVAVCVNSMLDGSIVNYRVLDAQQIPRELPPGGGRLSPKGM